MILDKKATKRKVLIDNLHFEVKESECVAVVGQSGSGKSLTAMTILQHLPSEIKLSEQSLITLEGENLLTKSKADIEKIRGRDIAIIFQEPISCFNPVKTIKSHMLEALRSNKASKNEKLATIKECLKEVELKDAEFILSSYPHQLSGGMLQRVMIAIAILCKPKLLIADECTTALDANVGWQIIELLEKIKSKKKMSIIFITHDLAAASKIADKILVMKQGKRVEFEETTQIINNPQHEYSKKLIANMTSSTNLGKQTIKDRKILEICKAHAGYSNNQDIIKDINLALYPGRTCALVGASGSGKPALQD